MQDAYEFLNEKLRSEKREKNYFFCELNIKDGNVFYTDIYIYNIYIYNIYIYIYIIYIYTIITIILTCSYI